MRSELSQRDGRCWQWTGGVWCGMGRADRGIQNAVCVNGHGSSRSAMLTRRWALPAVGGVHDEELDGIEVVYGHGWWPSGRCGAKQLKEWGGRWQKGIGARHELWPIWDGSEGEGKRDSDCTHLVLGSLVLCLCLCLEHSFSPHYARTRPLPAPPSPACAWAESPFLGFPNLIAFPSALRLRPPSLDRVPAPFIYTPPLASSTMTTEPNSPPDSTDIPPSALPLPNQPMTIPHPPKKKRVDDNGPLPPDIGLKPVQLQRRRVWRACESCR